MSVQRWGVWVFHSLLLSLLFCCCYRLMKLSLSVAECKYDRTWQVTEFLAVEICWRLAQRQILSYLSTQRNPFAFYFRMVTCILTGSFAKGAVHEWHHNLWCSFLNIKLCWEVRFWPKGVFGVFNISVCVVLTDAQLKDRTRPFGAAAAVTQQKHTGFFRFINSTKIVWVFLFLFLMSISVFLFAFVFFTPRNICLWCNCCCRNSCITRCFSSDISLALP